MFDQIIKNLNTLGYGHQFAGTMYPNYGDQSWEASIGYKRM
ncbi:hypothetical protein FHS21_001646 [Phyllobacterium trifolii]|uniref:Uncharacterized protein n=1 Tax=Phyllobacterium trifolii TaxID=300193 RepID=A0A839U943_9HYPH|nr:hypothetical protein [Phyllobacterium trifolii]